MNDTEQTQDENYVGLADLASTLVRLVAKNNAVSNRKSGRAIPAQADRITNTVVGYAIRRLKRMTDCRLPADDANLKNVWEEICVQVQGRASLAWQDYVDTIESILAPAAGALGPDEKEAAWLVTKAGRDWQSGKGERADDKRDTAIGADERESSQHNRLSPPVDVGEIVDYLKDLLLIEAEDFANENIRRYLAGRIID
jgi:hypothetical protein